MIRDLQAIGAGDRRKHLKSRFGPYLHLSHRIFQSSKHRESAAPRPIAAAHCMHHSGNSRYAQLEPSRAPEGPRTRAHVGLESV